MYVPSSQMSFNFLCLHNQSMVPLKTRMYLTVIEETVVIVMTVKAKLKSDCAYHSMLTCQ